MLFRSINTSSVNIHWWRHCANSVVNSCMASGSFTHCAAGYNYGEHYMPHDANHGSPQTGNTFKQQAELTGIRPIYVVDRPQNNAAVIAQTNGIRSILSQCWFDQDKCRDGLSALECYRSEWDEKMKRPGLHPVHDWASHGAAAMRTFISGYAPKTTARPRQPRPRAREF